MSKVWVIYTRKNALCGNLAMKFGSMEAANEWINDMTGIEVIDICKSIY